MKEKHLWPQSIKIDINTTDKFVHLKTYKFDYFGEVIEAVFAAYSRIDDHPMFMFPGDLSTGIISNLKYGGVEIGVIQKVTQMEDSRYGFGFAPDHMRTIGEQVVDLLGYGITDVETNEGCNEILMEIHRFFRNKKMEKLLK